MSLNRLLYAPAYMVKLNHNQQSPMTPEFKIWYKECAAEHPKLTFVITAWLCIIAPLGFVPDSITQSEPARAFVNFMIGWAPMIKSFAAETSRQDWHRFTLSVIWALGPLVMLYFARLAYNGILPDRDSDGKKRMGSFGAFWGTVLIFVLLVLLFAHGRYSYYDEDAKFIRIFGKKLLNYSIGTGMGLWTIGWLFIWFGWGLTGFMSGYYLGRKLEHI
jgi:hypothetical protein